MKVEAHIIAWNEAETIALTIRHYQSFCNDVTLYDNFSDDGTPEIAAKMGARVIKFGIPGVLDDREYTKLKNECWKGSKADWVIVVDCDEILINKFGHMRETLKDCLKNGSKILRPQGWQVINNDMPRYNWTELTNGYKDDNYSKLCCFSPAIEGINYVHGCHVAKTKDRVTQANDLFLMHYRNVGGPERLVARHALYRQRLSDWNKKWNAGVHYTYEDTQRRKEWQEQYERSKPF